MSSDGAFAVMMGLALRARGAVAGATGVSYAPPAASHAPQAAATAAAPEQRPAGARRLVSLDVLRGLTVAAMVLVNNPGNERDVHPALAHVVGIGWGLTETIAPAFLWIIGVALVVGRPRAAGEVVRRAAILFALGLLVAATPRIVPLLQLDALATLRIPGTLQRIALCYLAAGVLHRRLSSRAIVGLCVVLVAGYWMLPLLAPSVAGASGPHHVRVERLNAYVDHLLMGRHAKAHDPLGVVSTLPSVATALLGVLAGRFIARRTLDRDRLTRLLVAGGALLGGGLLLDTWIPVSEALWTPSFVLLMAGVATVAFVACHWLLDGRGSPRVVTPLLRYGTNALGVFVLSQMLQHTVVGVGLPALGRAHVSLRGIVYDTVYRPIAPPALASLLYALTWVVVFYLLSVLMVRRRWILRA